MADVLIVCVREDEPKAKALADMFEAAGFSIGGAPSSDAGLRSSGAGVVVWSQASIRSRPFLDAAQRVINADKAVVASLIDPPPPSSIGNAAAFDLSRWDGDPNDPALDPLFFAVDRMVNAARASVGAPAARRDYTEEPPPAPRAPPPRAAQAPQRAAPLPPAADPLGDEAEHWRVIRDSRDAADFMDYLARYGPDGAFSEVAELRLRQLTSGGAPPSAPRAASRPAPRVAESPAPPPRRVEPRRADPPPQARRVDVAPPRRPPERDYDRPDLHEPPRGEGGGLRMLVLIALLGAVLAGGYYFSGMGQGGAPATEQAESVDAPLSSPNLEAPATPDYSQTERGTFEEAPVQSPARNEPAAATRAPEQRETERPRQVERVREEPVPPPTTSYASSGGPISLSPGQQQSTTRPSEGAPSVVVPLRPAPVAPTSVNPTPSTQQQATRQPAAPGTVSWTQRPSARRIAELYPERALNQGLGGRVQLDCVVMANLSVQCAIASETPVGVGFGRAAMSASSAYRASPTLSNGASAVGTRTRIAVNFQAPQ
ncbi:MAG: hypothetical protein AB7O98_14760 [Hyphomonadaceae bacterium]